jgi:hypothetical protein
MNSRWVYFVVDIADYSLQRLYFNTPTVEFKIGSELDLLNRSLSLIRIINGSLHRAIGRWFIPPARAIIGIASLLGTTQGGVMVRMFGRDHSGDDRADAICVFAEKRGEIIPAILPSVAGQMILAGHIKTPGIVRHTDWISRERLIGELNTRGVQIFIRAGQQGDWRRLRAKDLSQNTPSAVA